MTVLATYVLAAAGAGAMAGAVVGLLGTIPSTSARFALGTLLGTLAGGIGLAGLVGRDRPLLQCDRETPKEWVQRGPVVWPLLNGAALGLGATSRLGFWLWYSIPMGCFLMASPAIGAAIWGAYGFARTVSAGVIWLIWVIHPGGDTLWLMRQRNRARAATAALTIVLGLATFVVMGL